ncbi:hypothetical protein D3C81_1349310 [compost metagenome]
MLAGFAEGHVFVAARSCAAFTPFIQAGFAVGATQVGAGQGRERLDQAAGCQVDGVALEQVCNLFTADVFAVQRLNLFSGKVLQLCLEVRQT